MAFVWLFVVLKIPVVALLWLIWYAAKAPEPLVDGDGGDGGSGHPDPHRGPRVSRPPRRGPHAGEPLPSPARVRTAAAPRRTRAPR